MNYLTFGFPTIDLDQVRAAVERGLGIEMVPHDSSYWGEYYLWNGNVSDEIQVVLNEEPMDGEPFEEEYPHLGVLIYASLSRETYDPLYQALSSIPTIQLIGQETL